MKLGILDQAPISKGSTAGDALQDAIRLAQTGESLGYERFWLAEHHAMLGFASSTPEVTLAAIGSRTESIRIGSGATLIPYYSPYKVAENYHTLGTLFPGRVNLGIGRAPGGPAEATEALNKEYLKNVYANEERISELNDYIHHDNHTSKLKMSPLADPAPEVWMLGTSVKSAELAGKLGMNYCFGYFMSNAGDMQEVLDAYRKHFTPKIKGQKPQVMVTVTAFVAESDAEARDIAMSSIVWGIEKERSFGESDVDDGLPSERQFADDLHHMTHQKVTASQKWGHLEITDERIEEMYETAEASDYTYRDFYMRALEAWMEGDFSNAVQVHNTIWNEQNGNVGKATGLMTEEEEREYKERHFE